MLLNLRLILGVALLLTGLSTVALRAGDPLFSPPPLTGQVAAEYQATDSLNEQAYWMATRNPIMAAQSRERIARDSDTHQRLSYQQPAQTLTQLPLTTTSFDPTTISETNSSPQVIPQQPNSFYESSTEYGAAGSYNGDEPWTYQLLPDGTIYRAYLAGGQESRLRSLMFYKPEYGWLWDITLGGRFALYRYGTTDTYSPEGWQLDVEGAAMPRLDFEHDMNMVSADFRAGLLMTRGDGPWRTKFGYYHLSSHLGDEQLIAFPTTPRYNYARDCLIIGQAYYITPEIRLYGETAWAFYVDVGNEWEFQFGAEYAPAVPTGSNGAPFAAVNSHLREELNFGGNLALQVGWAWRDGPAARMFRLGFEYFNGLSDQMQFWNQFEEKLGFGAWYDY